MWCNLLTSSICGGSPLTCKLIPICQRRSYGSFIILMEDNDLIDIVEEFKRYCILGEFTKNLYVPQCYDQLVGRIIRQDDVATKLPAIDIRFASTMSPQRDGLWFRVTLLEGALDYSPCDDCLTFHRDVGHRMVTFGIINNSVLVDHSNNRFKYIQTIPVNLEQTLTIAVQHGREDCEPIVIILLCISGDKISGDELDDMGEKDEGGEG
jgi:hypothetical protein